MKCTFWHIFSTKWIMKDQDFNLAKSKLMHSHLHFLSVCDTSSPSQNIYLQLHVYKYISQEDGQPCSILCTPPPKVGSLCSRKKCKDGNTKDEIHFMNHHFLALSSICNHDMDQLLPSPLINSDSSMYLCVPPTTRQQRVKNDSKILTRHKWLLIDTCTKQES